MIVDTPLARLDSEHRANLVEHYFPRASHQVVLLSTDTEVDASLLNTLAPHVARAYHLEYDAAGGHTVRREGYFWTAPQDRNAADGRTPDASSPSTSRNGRSARHALQ